MNAFGLDLVNLQNLLKDPNDDHSSDEDEKPTNTLSSKIGPGSIGEKKKESKKEIVNHYEKVNSKNIWDEKEVEEDNAIDLRDDPRKQPEYEFVYAQSLSSEDVFLQMNRKSASTASCENLIVKIKLPDVNNLSEIDLNVFKQFIDCRTIEHKLGLHLPDPVDPNSSNAKWDSANKTLIVTLKLQRDFDFINF